MLILYYFTFGLARVADKVNLTWFEKVELSVMLSNPAVSKSKKGLTGVN